MKQFSILISKIVTISIIASLTLFASGMEKVTGKKVFETYCWGCHHQSAVAFGPSFSFIASKRSAGEIQGMITDPKNVSKIFGYKRNAMPPFELNSNELQAITDYILSYKPEGK